MSQADQPSLLITGGSGYLGQFLVHALSQQYKVVYTYGTRLLSSAPASVIAVQVDLASGEGLQAAFQAHGPFVAAVNCAAISQPGLCEKEPESARAVNVPGHLIAALKGQREATGVSALLIHISTDQVYDGSKAMWTETDACEPVNQYGKTKLEGERVIQREWPESVLLRSSIIYGPQSPDPVPRPLFLQFVDKVVSSREPTTFFQDEFRCPIYVQDIVKIVQLFISRKLDGGLQGLLQESAGGGSLVLNMGGPERLSRVDIALQVADRRGLSRQETGSVVIPVPAASVNRGVASPADISMASDKLVALTGISLTPLSEAIKECLA